MDTFEGISFNHSKHFFNISENTVFYICPIVSSHTLHTEAREVYFCTVTCYKWLNLIEEGQAYKSVYRWFEHLKRDGCLGTGYVPIAIGMPNHFHVLLFPTHSGTSLNLLVGECKRFMAYDIVNSLKRQGREDILKILCEGVEPKEKLRGKLHEVFRPSFDADCATVSGWWSKSLTTYTTIL